jgi:hypothetical protein
MQLYTVQPRSKQLPANNTPTLSRHTTPLLALLDKTSIMLDTFPGDDALAAAAAAVIEAPADVSKAVLLGHLTKLPYVARLSAVSQWANRNCTSPHVAEMVSALTRSIEGQAVELVHAAGASGKAADGDDDMSNLFPPTSTSVPANFHEHQLGVFAAAATKDKGALIAAATSASRLLKRLAIKEVTRLGEPDEIRALLRAALPKDRREFVAQCVRFRKHEVLSSVFGELRELDGDETAARSAHGLTGAELARHLPSLFESRGLCWSKLWRFHSPQLLGLLEAELCAAHVLSRAAVWQRWAPKLTHGKRAAPHSGLQQQQHGGGWRALLKLWLAHRPYVVAPAWADEREALEARAAAGEPGDFILEAVHFD